MKHPLSRLAALAGLLLGSLTPAHATPLAEHVFIVSFDQTGPADVARAAMPVYKAMAAEGAHTWEAYTIVPSNTLPSHASMLTGVGVQKHQIVWNDTWTPEKPRLSVPTVFALAKTHGLRTALFATKQKFRLFAASGGIDHFQLIEDGSSTAVATAAVQHITTTRPNVCLIHFGDPDIQGHAHGVDSPEKKAALAEADTALAALREAARTAGILEKSVFILTADHGGHNAPNAEGRLVGTHGSAQTDDVTIPWIAWGASVKPGYIIATPVIQYDTAATALWLLGVDVPAGFWGRPIHHAFKEPSP